MDRREALAIIDATLTSAGFVPTGPGAADYEGQIKVHGSAVDIALSIPDVRFATRPRIIVKDRNQIPVETLAHVEEETGICYASGAGLPLDLYQPGEAILRVLEEARSTLELSYGGKGHAELIDEYQSYWKAKLPVQCMLPRAAVEDGRHAVMFLASRNGKADFVCISDKPELRGYDPEASRKVLFWRTDTLIGPADGIMVPETLPDLQKWLAGHKGLKNRNWNSLVRFLSAGHCLFIVAPNALVGLTVKLPPDIGHAASSGKIRPEKLADLVGRVPEKVALNRYSGRWSSLADVTDRNNPNAKDLSQKSVALIGCGTIGSHLARMLVQAGAGNAHILTLFDPELLAHGNIGRHLLGFGDIGIPKATAVATELERFHPQVHVAAYQQDALLHLDVIGQHDLVIDATGEWNVQSALNEWFLDGTEKKTAALLHSWVFMNGAGVQSFLNLNDEFACFRCLKPAFDGKWRFPAGDEKDALNLQPATCGDGSFIPFTVDAPVMAASLACRAALDWVNEDPGPRLRSAVVDVRRGRHQQPRSPTPADTCPACAPRRTSQ